MSVYNKYSVKCWQHNMLCLRTCKSLQPNFYPDLSVFNQECTTNENVQYKIFRGNWLKYQVKSQN